MGSGHDSALRRHASGARLLKGRVRSPWLLVAGLVGALVASAGFAGAVAATGPSPEAGPARVDEAHPADGSLGLGTFRRIAARYDEGVVNINTTTVVEERGHSRGPRDLLRDFFGDQAPLFPHDPDGPERRTRRSLGSGFVIDAEGYVLTNGHVVEGADTIEVTFSDGRHSEAKLVGRDTRTDVALLKIDPGDEDLTVLELGSSDEAEVGEWVMAIGNPFGLGGNSVTVGVVSFAGRPLRLGTAGTSVRMIQTDASINPGNSGGPLLDTEGRVVGINTMIVAGGARQSSGVGFAVPIDVARDILPQLREKGHVDRGWLGVAIQPVTEDLAATLDMKEARGSIVSEVNPGGPAERAGLQPGDVILGLDGEALADTQDLIAAISGRKPGERATLRILRDGEERDLQAELGRFPDEETAPADESGDRSTYGMTLGQLTPALARRLGLEPETPGALVTGVEPATAAERAGVRPGDLIVEADGRSVAGPGELVRRLEAAGEGELIRLRVARGGSYTFLVLRVE